MRLNATVKRIERGDGGFLVAYHHDDRQVRLEADTVLMAVGRHPVLPDGCGEARVKVDRGQPVVETSLQTTLSHVYACGDVNGRSPLFHSAVRQSVVAAHNILGAICPSTTWTSMPSRSWCSPSLRPPTWA